MAKMKITALFTRPSPSPRNAEVGNSGRRPQLTLRNFEVSRQPEQAASVPNRLLPTHTSNQHTHGDTEGHLGLGPEGAEPPACCPPHLKYKRSCPSGLLMRLWAALPPLRRRSGCGCLPASWTPRVASCPTLRPRSSACGGPCCCTAHTDPRQSRSAQKGDSGGLAGEDTGGHGWTRVPTLTGK